MKSEYLSKFKEAAPFFKLYGNKILIERVEMGEVKTAGGIIIAEAHNMRADLKMQKPHVAIVLACGPGYFDASTSEYEALEVKPGNVVIVSAVGAQYYSLLPGSSNYNGNKVGITTEGDVQMIFEDMEAFKQYAAALGGSVE